MFTNVLAKFASKHNVYTDGLSQKAALNASEIPHRSGHLVVFVGVLMKTEPTIASLL